MGANCPFDWLTGALELVVKNIDNDYLVGCNLFRMAARRLGW
jgi:hypothetical protein